MPTLRITVVEPPPEFAPYSKITLVMQTSNGHVPAASIEPDSIVFDVPFDLKPDRAGCMQPVGPCVQRENDGRRFVYLSWLGTQGTSIAMFRRLKVYFNTAKGFPGAEAQYEVRVRGQDKRGGPACATAFVL